MLPLILLIIGMRQSAQLDENPPYRLDFGRSLDAGRAGNIWIEKQG